MKCDLFSISFLNILFLKIIFYHLGDDGRSVNVFDLFDDRCKEKFIK